MAFTIKWSEEALEDIESIATYIEKDSPTYAKWASQSSCITNQVHITFKSVCL